MIHDPVPPEDWAAEGTRIASSLEEVAAAVVVGRDPRVSLFVARAMALAQRDGRHVAIGDLVGGLPGVSPADGAPGLLECFRDGVPVSAIARELNTDPPIFALPSGSGEVAARWMFESARWTRLVAGFREVDALLLLIVPVGAEGLDSLIRVVDGVVAVDLPPTLVRRWPLLATVDRPEPELPPIVPSTPTRASELAAARTASRARRRLAITAALVLATSVAVVAWFARPIVDPMDDMAGADQVGAATGEATGAAPATPSPDPIATDTITLGAIVNPADSAIAATFTVELVAANTLAGANSRLAMRGETVPAPTVAPVLLGTIGRPWYRALAGAWRREEEAQAYLDALRRRGLVRQDVGRVLRAPLALLLAEGLRDADVPATVARWASRGIPAYALMQDDGSARVYAGAFETSGQAALLAMSLRDIGIAPVLAFRTGRTF